MVAGVVSVPAANQPSVLVIDDEYEIREFLTDFLSLEGFDVTTIADPSTAIDRIRGAAFDLILLDLMMPKISGLDLLSQIRAVDGDIPVILMSSGLQFDDDTVDYDVSGCIRHPLTTPELRAVIFGATGISSEDDEVDEEDDEDDDDDEDDADDVQTPR